MTYADRGERFRESYDYIRKMAEAYPHHESGHGVLKGAIDMLPKPTSGRLPMLITGGSQQSPDWLARHGDGWMTYPRDAASQGRVVADYRKRLKEAGESDKPVMQSLYIDLLPEPNADPRPIHLGFQSGTHFLREYLQEESDTLPTRFEVEEFMTEVDILSSDVERAEIRLAQIARHRNGDSSS